MKKIKILHCSDFHLGAELSSIGIKSRKRKIENLLTFDNIISTCRNEQVELLLIAGDLFDNFKVKEDDILHVKKSFASIADTIVAIAPGNHDALLKGSSYLDEDWSENVIIFKNKLEYRELPALHTRVWGAGFLGIHVSEPLLGPINVPEDDFINICVLHGELVGPSGKSDYNPISKELIQNSQMDYIALGHIHQRSPIQKLAKVSFAYSGNPEGGGFDELGEKGVLLVDVWKGRTEIEFRPLAYRMYLELFVELEEESNTMEVINRIQEEMKKKYGKDFSKHLYKVILRGRLPAQTRIDLDEIKIRLEREVFFVKVKDETMPEISVEDLAKELSLKGIFLRKVQDKIMEYEKAGKQEEKEKYEKAMKIGLKAFYNEVVYHED